VCEPARDEKRSHEPCDQKQQMLPQRPER
jgi:hypothetical protein